MSLIQNFIKNIFFDTAGLLAINGGVYYMYETYKNYTDTRGLLTQHQAAVYAEGEYTFNEYVSTSLGLRYNYSNIYAGTPNPRFYVNVNPTSWWTIKAGIANGMKIPSITELGNGFCMRAIQQRIMAILIYKPKKAGIMS